jgi:hypothetical protein
MLGEVAHMLEIPRARITAIAGARSARELQPHLQGALELKIAAIPPYLTALFSLCDGKNSTIREMLHGVVVDEMLHVALIANLLNAIRCPPNLSALRLARCYPARLPLDATGLELNLKKFSLDLVRDVFMALDQSADRGDVPNPAAGARVTLCQFYGAIIEKLEDLGDPVFIGDPALQFIDAVSYSERDLFRVYDVESAARALRLISGEGNCSASGAAGSARWHRLRQIVCAPPGAKLAALDPASVINIVENSRASMYEPRSPARAAVDAFNVAYCSILTALNESFNGRRERYEFAVSGMYGLTGLARSIVAIERDDGTFAAPSFEYSECAQTQA